MPHRAYCPLIQATASFGFVSSHEDSLVIPANIELKPKAMAVLPLSAFGVFVRAGDEGLVAAEPCGGS